MTFTRYALVASVGALVLLTGCDKTKEALGLKREQPDEFTILSRPPLSAPPRIALAPPKPGAKPTYEKDASHEAQASLGVSSGATSGASSAEKALLAKAHVEEGAKDGSPDPTLKEDTSDDVPYLFGNASAKKGDVIDPVAEKKKYENVPTSGPKSH